MTSFPPRRRESAVDRVIKYQTRLLECPDIADEVPPAYDRCHEDLFAMTELDDIDLGSSASNPGGELRAQFRKMRAKGFTGVEILHAKAGMIKQAKRLGHKAGWNEATLAEWCVVIHKALFGKGKRRG